MLRTRRTVRFASIFVCATQEGCCVAHATLCGFRQALDVTATRRHFRRASFDRLNFQFSFSVWGAAAVARLMRRRQTSDVSSPASSWLASLFAASSLLRPKRTPFAAAQNDRLLSDWRRADSSAAIVSANGAAATSATVTQQLGRPTCIRRRKLEPLQVAALLKSYVRRRRRGTSQRRKRRFSHLAPLGLSAAKSRAAKWRRPFFIAT